MSEDIDKKDEALKSEERAKKAAADAIKNMQSNSLRKNHVVVGKGLIEPLKIPKGHSGFVEIEFTKPHGTHDVGSKEIYHHSTAAALVNKLEVAKVVSSIEKYTPRKLKT
jgi:hypothetical protein